VRLGVVEVLGVGGSGGWGFLREPRARFCVRLASDELGRALVAPTFSLDIGIGVSDEDPGS
jgi:hypothetical protein